MKKRMRARALACGFTAAALLLAGSGCAKREKEPELTGRERVKAELTRALNTLDQTAPAPAPGGVDLTATLELGDGSFNGMDLNDYLRDSSIGLRVDAPQGDRLGVEGDVTVMGERFIGGTAIYDGGVLGFQVPELDSTYYTIDFNDLLGQSEEGRRYLDMLERAQSAERVDIPTEKIMSVAGRYIDVVADTVTRDNTTKAKADFSFEKLDGAENSGTVWVFTPTAQDVTGFTNRLADQLEDDQELQDLLMDYAQWVSDAMGVSMMEEWGSSPDELRAELAQELAQVAQELRDGAEDAGQEAEDAHFQCTLYTAQNGAWKVEVTFHYQGEPLRACAEGCDTGFAIWAEEDENGRHTTVYELVFQYEKTGGEYSGTMTWGVDDGRDTVTMELSFEHVTDQTSSLGLNYGSYALSIPNLGKVYLDVTRAAGGGTDHVISLDIPTLSRACKRGGMPDFNTARLTLHTTDQKTAIPTPGGARVDLTGMDSAELEELFGPWEERWKSLPQDFLDRLRAAY